MAEDEDANGKGRFDISKSTESNESFLSAGARLAGEFDRLNPSLDAITKAYEASGLANLSDTNAVANMSAVQQALYTSNSDAASRIIRDIDMTVFGVLATRLRNLDMSSVGVLADLTKRADLGIMNVAAQQMLDFDSTGGGAFAKLARGIGNGVFEQAIRAIKMSDLRGVVSTLDAGSLGHGIADANRSLNLGLPSEFGQDLQLAASGISEQMKALGGINLTVRSSIENFGLSNLEALLEKSLAVQETLLEEHQQSTLDAKTEASFHRRLNSVMAIVAIIMFLINLVYALQDWTTDEDAAIEANTAAIIEMREAFAAGATQMESMRDTQEAEADRQSEADAEIAAILRDIANVLGNQAKPEE